MRLVPRRPQQLFGVLQRFGRELLAGQKPPDFPRSSIAADLFDASHGAPIRLQLLDNVVEIGKARNLGEVRDAQHLIGSRELLQPASDAFRRPSTDSGIHLVEHQGSRSFEAGGGGGRGPDWAA